MEVKAKLRYARIGTQKARQVADVVRGKDVNEALKLLAFLNKKAGIIVKKLIESAVANAEQKQVIDVDNLYVKTITVDQGPGMRRFVPKAQGRATPVVKKMSHIDVVLEER